MIRLFSFLVILTLGPTLALATKQPALIQVLANVGQLTQWGDQAFAITDLDETIVDSTPRRFVAYQEALREQCLGRAGGNCAKVAGWNIQEFYSLANRYNQSPLFDSLNIAPGVFRRTLENQSLDHYLSGNYESYDQAIPGAVEFVQQLKALNVRVYFVSSRNDSKQRASTIESLLSLGLLLHGEEKDVILKPDGMSSIEFKRWAFQKIKDEAAKMNASVEVVMENEPENMNAMTEIFPSAQAIFVNGAFIKDEPLRGQPIRVQNFR